jgi:putative flippase GtrA
MRREKLPGASRLHHFGGFIAAGLAALAVDALILWLATDWLQISPYVARLFSISCAMVVSWQINRRLTFAVTAPATLHEFGRFAAVSWIAQAVNYAAFAGILVARPGTWPVFALISASLIAMFVSYAGFRFGVFRKA